jgi:drug/metabolite transporter (DMT)-like permease
MVGELAALGAAFLWANSSLLFTKAGARSTPVAANAFKVTAATLLFTATLWIRDGGPVPHGVASADVLRLAASGVLGLTLGDSLLFKAYLAIGTRRAMLLQSMSPVFGAFGALAILHEHLGIQAWLGIFVALAGVVMVISEKGDATPLGHPRRVGPGVMLGLGAALGQASGALFAKAALERVDTLMASQIRLASAAVVMLVVATLLRRLRGWARLLSNREVLWRVSLGSLVGPFVAIWLMIVSLDLARTGVALTLMATTPIWLLPLGWMFQGDRPSPREAMGAVVAIAGVAILLLRG